MRGMLQGLSRLRRPWHSLTNSASESAEICSIKTAIGPIFIGAEQKRRNHYIGVCDEVIGGDTYGVRALQEKGYDPKIIVDAGAHIGTYALMAARAWPNARIFCIEVMRDTKMSGAFERAIAHALDRNVSGLPNVTVIRKALIGFYGDPDADVVSTHHFGNNTPNFEDRIRMDLHRSAEAMSVADFLQENGLDHIDLLKIDTEGCEVNILRECAALDILKDIGAVRGEWHFDVARQQVPELLKKTHDVHLTWSGPGNDWNIFTADRRVQQHLSV